ncbi:putative GDP-fucose protein O-fucosyltransferase [Helianthus annuus]|nr:putative GDP-fucose protein O-fucosyltransferase [Helianthus annuus]
MKEHGAIYLTTFSHRLAEENDNSEYQRLRCRVNYHALRFKPHIVLLSQSIAANLRSQGHFMSIHLRLEKDMLSFAGKDKDSNNGCSDTSDSRSTNAEETKSGMPTLRSQRHSVS